MCPWPMGAQTPLGLGIVYRVPTALRLSVLCSSPGLSLPVLEKREEEQEQGGWLGCRAKLSLKEELGAPSPWHRPRGSPAGEATYCGSQRSRTLGSWSRW